MNLLYASKHMNISLLIVGCLACIHIICQLRVLQSAGFVSCLEHVIRKTPEDIQKTKNLRNQIN